MRIDQVSESVVVVTLSRRNLLALLAKLDGHPVDSAKTIYKENDATEDGLPVLVVRAEDDDMHYGRREYGPGLMHISTETVIRGV